IRCDKDNNVYIGGITNLANSNPPVGGSSGLATPGAYKTDTIGKHDGFLAKFSSTGALRWATYFGGTENECIGSIDCDSKGNVYVAGNTQSAGIATVGNTTLSGAMDAFLAKFDANGTHIWTTYLGGEGTDGNMKGIHVYKDDDILMLTGTGST